MTVPPASSPRGALPRGDPAGRLRLSDVGGRVRPVTLARARTLPVPGALGGLLPENALRRGATITVEGEIGKGATSLAFTLAAAATAAGEWAGAVDLDGTLGGEAAAAAGVTLERFVVIRSQVLAARWATVVAALLDGVTVVVAEVPRYVALGDARRLVARARERGTVLVALPPQGARWPASAALHLHAEGGSWSGLGRGTGVLAGRQPHVRAEGVPGPAGDRVVAQAG